MKKYWRIPPECIIIEKEPVPRWIAGRGALSKEKMTTMKHENKMIYRVTLTAVFAALVFVSSMLSVPIPVAIGDVTRIHLGNIFCLLSGFVLGPVGGGLAAGLGSALYDMTNPAYIASAPFTFVFKFLLAAVCGWAAYARGSRAENHGQNILAAIAGSATYMVLYLGKSFIEGMLLGSALVPVLLSVGTKRLRPVSTLLSPWWFPCLVRASGWR